MQEEPLTINAIAGNSAGTRILRVAGRLALPNFLALQKEFLKETTPVTILDLSDVPNMDSAGMGVILNYFVAAQKRGHKLIVVGASVHVVALFRLTKVDSLIPMAATLEDAESLL